MPDDPQIWAALDPALIATFLEYQKTIISTKTGNPYSTATIARRFTAVKELLTEATYLGLYPRQQLEYIKDRLSGPDVTNEHHAGITPDEQAALLNATSLQQGLKGQRDYTLLRLWLDTGLRRAEMAALQVRDLMVKAGIPTLIVR